MALEQFPGPDGPRPRPPKGSQLAAFQLIERLWPMLSRATKNASKAADIKRGPTGALNALMRRMGENPDIEHGAWGLSNRARPAGTWSGGSNYLQWPAEMNQFMLETPPQPRRPGAEQTRQYDMHTHPNQSSFSDQDLWGYGSRRNRNRGRYSDLLTAESKGLNFIPGMDHYVLGKGADRGISLDKFAFTGDEEIVTTDDLLELRKELSEYLSPHRSYKEAGASKEIPRAALAAISMDPRRNIDFGYKPLNKSREDTFLNLLDKAVDYYPKAGPK